MHLPVIRGVIDWRILVNYRVAPDVLAKALPAPFRPQIIHGVGLAGICLIRLKEIRPRWLPAWLGIASENAAHRIAVEWDEGAKVRTGVFVRRRDTNNRLNSWAGGRIFPGVHHHACFTVNETADEYEISLQSDDGRASVSIHARCINKWPANSIFNSLDEASAFFEAGCCGYSPTADPSRLQGLELRCFDWQAAPLEMDRVQSSFFKDERLFPTASIQFDCALLMRDIHHEWHRQPDLHTNELDCRASDGDSTAGALGCQRATRESRSHEPERS